MRKLEKIRKEIDKRKKISPYNFCDRWCDKCALPIREKCKVYQETFDFNLRCIADGKDPYDIEIILGHEKEKLKKTIELIAELAEKNSVDISNMHDSESQAQKISKEQLQKHPLYVTTLQYSQLAKSFLDSFSNQEDLQPEPPDDFETILWYSNLLPAKSYRLLSDLYEQNNIEGAKDDFGIPLPLYDTVAQIEICLKSVSHSQKALSNFFSNHIECRYTLSDLLDLLKTIKDQLQLILHEIDNKIE